METKLSSEPANQVQRGRSGAGGKFGSMLPEIDPFVPKTNCDPRELRNWAKRTGYVSGYSGATETSASERNESVGFDLERGADSHRVDGSSPKIEIDPFLGRTKQNRGAEIEAASGSRNGGVRDGNDGFVGLSDGNFRGENQRRRIRDEPGSIGRDAGRRDELNGSSQGNESLNEIVNNRTENVNGNGFGAVTRVSEPKKDYEKDDTDMEFNVQPEGDEPAYGGWLGPSSEMKCGLTENPGLVQLLIYGLQHYMSLAGSLIFIPLIIVPAMGGTDKDTATVISTMMLISGITTILHIYLGTRLPLVHGSSFIYLAPALVIMNAQEYRNLTEHIQLSGIAKFFRLPFIISLKFRHIMKELQGAIIVGSIFQSLLGFSGLMSIFLRLINPVVVAPTVAAVGLAFFSYGFPQAGSCVEISIPLIILVLIFTLYLRGVSISGHHFFRIYAVPVSVMIVWIYAFFLTAGGAYNYKSCSPDIPSSNILIDACKRHAYTMKHCRTDVSNAWRTAAWVRVPFPLQWGIPIFHMRTSIIMIIVSVIASVDSVGTYHTTALLINLKPPTPGIVSRGIALEGLCSMLAGLWGSGTGSSTLTENIHTIDTTKMASRRAVELGAVVLIIFSFIGKVGAILASIPLALAASTLCFIWALTVALGLSTLQYGQAGSSRNIIIVGVSLFLGLSIPAYFQQYQPESSLILPSYFVPYGAASNGPVYTGSEQIDFALNGLMSLNMVVTFLVAFVLDNTVPGSRQERGVYEWSNAEDIRNDPSLLAGYSLPRRVARCFLWAKCLGVS